jgi:hypothetical protein
MASSIIRTTTLAVDLKSNDSDHNAVLYYQFDFPIHDTGTSRPKEKFLEVRTEPVMTTYSHLSASLVTFVKTFENEKCTKAILYSKEGFQMRKETKHEQQEAITRKTCTACCLTCGLALCFAGCCDCFAISGLGEKNLNEEHYCKKLNEKSPGGDGQQNYQFQSLGKIQEMDGDIPVAPSAPVEEGDILVAPSAPSF